MSWLSSIVGSVTGTRQANAIREATEDSTAFQREALDKVLALQQPSIDRGNATGDLYAAGFGITPTNFRASAAVQFPQNHTGTVPQRYGGLPAGVYNNPAINARFGYSADEYISQLGNEIPINGRDLTGTNAAQTPAGPRVDPATGLIEGTPEEYQKQAYDRFLSSGYNTAATEMSEADFDRLTGAYGAGGKMFSGASIKDLSKSLAGNRYGAYIDYSNGLAGLTGAGQTASSLAGSAQQNFANQAGNNALMSGNALASSYNRQGAMAANALGSILGGFF